MTRGAAAGSRYLLGLAGMRRIMREFGFSYEQTVEKFFVDFGALLRVLEEIPDCVVKGGMAVPFHIADPLDRRLSVDVDVVTRRPRDEVERRMARIRENAGGFLKIGDAHRPARAAKNLPLLTYYTGYGSSVGDGADIKIEIFHDCGLDMASEKISPPFDMFGVDVDFPLEVYDASSLIGDKLTTLAFGTVGIPEERRADVPKHVYYIATLARMAGGSFDLEGAAGALERSSQYEALRSGLAGLSAEDVAGDAAGFAYGLMSMGGRRMMTDRYRGQFNTFATRFLGSRRYIEHHHVSDMLLVIMLALLLRRRTGPGEPSGGQRMRDILAQLDAIRGMEDREKRTFKRALAAGHGKGSEAGGAMNAMPADMAFLYGEIRGAGGRAVGPWRPARERI